MMEEQRIGTRNLFPSWYFDPMTQFQAKRLNEDGVYFSPSFTKGQASDLVGLSEQADLEDLEVLRFFKRSLRGMNQTRARHEVALLFQQEPNRTAWEARPATDRQKEFFRFFDMPLSAGLLKREADLAITEKVKFAQEENDPKADQWDALERVLDDFADSQFCADYEMRKPTVPAVRKVVEALAAEKGWDAIDSDTVAERLLEVSPNLQR